MSILKDHLIQEIDGISPDDVVITDVEFQGNYVKICWVDYDDNNGILECEHIIKIAENKPTDQGDIIIVNERKRDQKIVP